MDSKAAKIDVSIPKNYDSEFCGSIPLHLVNLIQPHGVLLVLDNEQLTIKQASENVEQYLQISLEDLLEQPLSAFVPQKNVDEITQKIQANSNRAKIPLSLTFELKGTAVAFTALVHPTDEYVLVELEKVNSAADEVPFIGLYQHIKYLTSLFKQAKTCEEAAQVAADELKKLTGFDRVLVYQFDPHWNGIVIAQAKEPEMVDYLGLRFPASDVPKQARDLYFRSPYRLIPTRDYTPAKLIPIVNPLTQRFTDLSDCNLRSVATVHLEYLKNLNVMASMSLPLIINNQLWGLISCHHKTSKNPSYEMRSALELLSEILSAQLGSKESEADILLRVQMRGVHASLLEQLYSSQNFADGILNGATSILDLLSLTGAAVLYEGGIWTSGQTPQHQEMKELVSWIRRTKGTSLFATANLGKDYSRSVAYKDVASGVLALPINAEQGEYILGFRSEVLQTISWGGDPNNAIQMEADGKTYHPRNSFAIYKETVKHTSLPWKEAELEAAEVLRSAVLEKIIRENH